MRLILLLLILVIAGGAFCAEKEPFVKYEDTALITLTNMSYREFKEIMDRIESQGIRKVRITLFTFGGSVFDALAIAEEIEHSRLEIEVTGKGLIASAGLIVLVSAKKRSITDDTLIMFHEISTVKLLSIESISDQEEQSKLMRWLQNKVIGYICRRTYIKEAELANAIKKKEKWWTAEEALKDGIVHYIVGGTQ